MTLQWNQPIEQRASAVSAAPCCYKCPSTLPRGLTCVTRPSPTMQGWSVTNRSCHLQFFKGQWSTGPTGNLLISCSRIFFKISAETRIFLPCRKMRSQKEFAEILRKHVFPGIVLSKWTCVFLPRRSHGCSEKYNFLFFWQNRGEKLGKRRFFSGKTMSGNFSAIFSCENIWGGGSSHNLSLLCGIECR